MRLGIKLNLYKLFNSPPTYDYYVTFANVEKLTNSSLQDENLVTSIEVFKDNGNDLYVGVTTSNPVQQPEWEGFDEDAIDLSGTNDYIYFIADVEDIGMETFLKLVNGGYIILNQFGKTSIICYRLNDEKEKLNKTLTPVTIIEGKFTAPLGLKSLELDVVDYEIDSTYNYVYIPKLKRYYYITSVQLTTKDYTKLIVQEDVLMSWKELILIQTAFVTRNENIADNVIVDDRFPLESIKSIEYITPTATGTGNLTNITLKGKFESTDYNILLSCYDDVLWTKTNVTKPDTNLPDLSAIQSGNLVTYFLTLSLYDSFTKAILDQDTYASAINSILFLPFDPYTAFNTGNSAQTLLIGVPTSKALCSDDKFHYLYDIPSDVVTRQVRRTTYGTSPYLILADFTFPSLNDDWELHEPFSVYEIYIAFVGWVKVDSAQLSNKRVLIYYTLDYQTGNATAYIYNKTDGKIIYSCGCQLGVKLDIITSNALELSRERQASHLNTLIGLLTSAVSIGAGVVSENPVAVAGGILSAGKTIATAVNSERMRFERAQVTYGSGDSGLHSNLATMIRRTYNKPILSGYGISYYHALQGKPCNTYGNLSGFTGYTEVADIHFNFYNYDIYNDEVIEIVALLKNGVIL